MAFTPLTFEGGIPTTDSLVLALNQLQLQIGASGGGGSGLAVGTTAITAGTSGRILYDNSAVLGELPVGAGVATWIGVSSTDNLAAITANKTGYSGPGDFLVFNNAPTITSANLQFPSLTTPTSTDGTFTRPALVQAALGTPVSGNLTNCTGFPATTVGLTLSIGDGVNAISNGASSFPFVVPFAATITGYSIAVDSGTCTVKFWKIASGTAIPTVANVINTSGVAISTGTLVESSTTSDFTTTAVTAGDCIICNVTAISGPKFLIPQLKMTKP